MSSHSSSRRLRVLLTVFVVLTGAPVSSTRASAQELAQVDRGPRFLREVRRGQPRVEIDLDRTPVLYRRISLKGVERTLGELLGAIGKQAGLEFVYSADLLPVDKRMQFHADSITVAAALTEVLLGANVDVVFYSAKQAGLVRRMTASGTIIGRVTDAKTGAGVGKVEVFLNGTRWSTTTDTAGRFTLAEVDTGSYALVARRPGYAKATRTVRVLADQTDTVVIAMQPSAAKLDELVATATGSQRRRDIGNSIVTIRADSVMQSAAIRNVSDLLDGRVPGMSTQHTTGAPGDPTRFRLRGLGSINRSNDPVVIVDGIRINSDQSSARAGNLTNLAPVGSGAATSNPIQNNKAAPSPLDQIDPNMIEKVEVFKGPSAATLYGADAANGVIVITTKKGKPGPTRWNASYSHNVTKQAGDYPLAYLRWGHTASSGGQPLLCPLANATCVADSLITFQMMNDPSTTLLGTGHENLMSLSASGGTQTLTYSVTGSYNTLVGPLKMPGFAVDSFRSQFNREPFDWMERPHNYQMWNVGTNLTARPSQKFDITLSAQFSSSDQQRSALEDKLPLMQGSYFSPVFGCCLVPSTLTRPLALFYTIGYDSPLKEFFLRTTASTFTSRTSLNASWRPMARITVEGRAGIDIQPRSDEALLPSGYPLHYDPNVPDAVADQGAITRGSGLTRTGTFDLRTDYRKPLKAGFVFATSVGANVTTSNVKDFVAAAWNLVEGTTSLTRAGTYVASDNIARSSVFGWYIEPRITGERFSLSTGLRLDGGTAYGTKLTTSGNGGGSFLKGLLALPKLNGAWTISEEPWFPFGSLFSSLRLRGSYGQAQVQPGVTDRLRLYQYGQNADAGKIVELSSIGNDELKPERSSELEGGFDAEILDGRFGFEFTGYRKVRYDMLVATTLPASVNGGGRLVQNLGDSRNTGIELTLRVQPVRTPFATWGIEANYWRNTNVLTKLGAGIAPDRNRGIVVGYPLYGRWSKPILGFSDQNGDGAIQPLEVQVGDSAVFMGRLEPAYNSTVATNLALFNQAVVVSANFEYEGGNTQVNESALRNWVLTRALVDPSTPLSQQAAVQAFDRTTYGVTQAISTLRFRSLAINYQVPTSIARALRAQSMRLSLRGDNLGLHTSYSGMDPDVTAWSAGERIVDTGQLGRPRTWGIAAFMTF